MESARASFRRLKRVLDARGTAAVEFALILPMLLILVVGIVGYGGYFWLAHGLQQLANDSARAAVGGLAAQERSTLARESFDDDLRQYPGLAAERANLTLVETANGFTVQVTYDASQSPFWVFASIVPMPSSTITRTASARLGGY